MSATMIATLGGQPQIVTFALDALLKRRVPISKVVVIYLHNPESDRLQAARKCLRDELNSPRYREQGIRAKFRPVKVGDAPLKDILTDAQVSATSTFINELVEQERGKGRMLHVCVSGGRRILSLLTMTTAMLSFQHPDKLWHMFTKDEIQAEARGGKIMHLPEETPEDEFRLIEVPVLPLGHYFASLRNFDGVIGQRRMLDEAEYNRCQRVVNKLAPREVDTLKAFANGWNRTRVATELGVSVKTVDHYKTKIYELCDATWDFPPNGRVTISFLATKFRDFFTADQFMH